LAKKSCVVAKPMPRAAPVTMAVVFEVRVGLEVFMTSFSAKDFH
jgi:hypothetical protein